MGRSTRRGPWLPEEDGTLLQLVHLQGPNNWVRISQHMQHRSPKQCRERYHQNLKPSLNHGPISPEEGEAIEQLVQDMGKRWAEIARRLGNRSDNAVKNWWNGSMNRRKRSNMPSGPVSRSVGPRPQPLPVSEPSRSEVVFSRRLNFDAAPRQSYPTLPHPERLSSENGCRRDNTSDDHTQLNLPSQPQSQSETNQSSTSLLQLYLPRPELQGPPLILESHSAPSSLNNTPDPFSFRSLHPQLEQKRLRPLSLESRHSYHHEWQLPRLHGLEPPSISPAVTEFSKVPSIHQAPSLISDNQSHYSISPKTVSSPRPSLPAPIDTSTTQIWHPDQRRNSYATCAPDSKYYMLDEGYVSALPVSTTTEAPTPSLPPDQLLNRCSSHQGTKSPIDTRMPGSSVSSPTERDARMNVSRLLE